MANQRCQVLVPVNQSCQVPVPANQSRQVPVPANMSCQVAVPELASEIVFHSYFWCDKCFLVLWDFISAVHKYILKDTTGRALIGTSNFYGVERVEKIILFFEKFAH